jgi:hypothetical protein
MLVGEAGAAVVGEARDVGEAGAAVVVEAADVVAVGGGAACGCRAATRRGTAAGLGATAKQTEFALRAGRTSRPAFSLARSNRTTSDVVPHVHAAQVDVRAAAAKATG